ncbi:membrane lipoprotein lipid attachment site-containing protein [Planctobacterium marinum]|uniref:Type IV secretion system putative lipoprotein virB7 n=1 Tax=Planctobacterium marinum TaxID=1631968 RepID=A0AA48HF09_9ALTE|nr:hypothetical protein MACH26_06870 [Planctobacterium marinum]
MKKLISVFCALAMLTGCSSVPPYQEFGFGGGYKEKEISDGEFELYYAGNGFATVDGVRKVWHQRASELCQGKPYKHEFSFDGKKSYNIYSGVSYFPVSVDFPEVIGVVKCNLKDSS